MHATAIGRVAGLSLERRWGDDASAEEGRATCPARRSIAPSMHCSPIATSDLVDIVAPDHLHADMAMKALEAGKHVLLEKPMANTLADAGAWPRPPNHRGRYCASSFSCASPGNGPGSRELIAEGVLGQMRFDGFGPASSFPAEETGSSQPFTAMCL